MTGVIRSADQGNECMIRDDTIYTIQYFHPGWALSRTSCSKLLTKHIINHPENKNLLHEKPFVDQAITTKISAITYEQQWRWHTAVDIALSMLREYNTGLGKLSGKSFGGLIGHFII